HPYRPALISFPTRRSSDLTDDNIKFGSAYLSILDSTYLAGIKHPTSRLYCAIAAYNTGAGNVASVFHPKGEKRIAEAVNIINELDRKSTRLNSSHVKISYA